TVPMNEPTMNLGQIIDGTGVAVQADRVVRHEFGHVLGLIHEHQNPNATIVWNVPAAMQYYGGPPNFWTASMIEQTILNKLPKFHNPEYRQFDPKSVMMFPIPEGLPNITVEWNTTLSESDQR